MPLNVYEILFKHVQFHPSLCKVLRNKQIDAWHPLWASLSSLAMMEWSNFVVKWNLYWNIGSVIQKISIWYSCVVMAWCLIHLRQLLFIGIIKVDECDMWYFNQMSELLWSTWFIGYLSVYTIHFTGAGRLTYFFLFTV